MQSRHPGSPAHTWVLLVGCQPALAALLMQIGSAIGTGVLRASIVKPLLLITCMSHYAGRSAGAAGHGGRQVFSRDGRRPCLKQLRGVARHAASTALPPQLPGRGMLLCTLQTIESVSRSRPAQMLTHYTDKRLHNISLGLSKLFWEKVKAVSCRFQLSWRPRLSWLQLTIGPPTDPRSLTWV